MDWEKGLFTVKSPKTEHHEHHQERKVPLFPELREGLEKHRSDCEFVIQGFQGTTWGLYVPFQKIANKAGLGIIKDPFVNMRRSRSNEVADRWRPKLESLWIGHTEQIMRRHYAGATDEDFLNAAELIAHAKSHAGADRNGVIFSDFR